MISKSTFNNSNLVKYSSIHVSFLQLITGRRDGNVLDEGAEERWLRKLAHTTHHGAAPVSDFSSDITWEAA